eukprot:1257951-Rhodomonas_salina.1
MSSDCRDSVPHASISRSSNFKSRFLGTCLGFGLLVRTVIDRGLYIELACRDITEIPWFSTVANSGMRPVSSYFGDTGEEFYW